MSQYFGAEGGDYYNYGEDSAAATSTASASGGGAYGGFVAGLEQTPEEAAASVSMQFCTQCHNLLYPDEDRVNRQLKYRCGTCSVTQHAVENRVARHVLMRAGEEGGGSGGGGMGSGHTIVQYDVGSDPTLPRVKRKCPRCDYDEAAFFQSYGSGRSTAMTIYLVCCNKGCNFKWVDEGDEEDEDAIF